MSDFLFDNSYARLPEIFSGIVSRAPWQLRH